MQRTCTNLIPNIKDLLLLHQQILSQLRPRKKQPAARSAKRSFFMYFELFLAVDLRGAHNCFQDRG